MSLKSERLKRGMTMTELAKASSVHIVKIAQIESGKIDPANMTLRNAVKLADALHIDPRELLRGDEDNE